MTLPTYSDLITASETLTANRSGQLTDEQRAWLKTFNPGFDLKAFGFAVAVLVFMGISFAPTASKIPAEGWWSITLAALMIGLAVGVPFLRNTLQHRQLTQELETGKVESAAGQVIWRGNQYRAQLEGRPLKTQIGFSIEPGDYTFYYLPQSRWLVGADRSTLQRTDAPTLQQVLLKVHRCNPEALDINRNGELAESQRRYFLFVVLANFFAALVALGLVALLAYNVPASATNDTIGGGYILMAVPLILTGFFIYRGVRLALDLNANTVLLAKGVGNRSYTGGRNPTFYYHIGEAQRLSVSSAAYFAFIEGKHYKIYYTPRAKRIVNIEIGTG
jgi:hypothetical protein